jgi:MerR family transcriptional regulator, light-induced transcriptional regulator
MERMTVLEPLNGVYNIQQAADITGISKQLIRKWEERYEIIQPQRLDNGYRIYTEREISTLLTVKALTEQGYSVKQAVVMLKNKQEDPSLIQNQIPQQTMIQSEWNDYVMKLLQHGTHCYEEGILLNLQHAYHHLGLDRCIHSVLIPFLREIGNRWETGVWSEYQESFSSLIVRDFLVQIRRNFPSKEGAPLLLGACLPGERHEIPVHLLLLQLMLIGYKTVLIGASPAPGTIEAMVKELKPAKVLLSASTTTPLEDVPLLDKLDQFASEQMGIEFYLGGEGTIYHQALENLKSIKVTNAIEELNI